MSRLRKRWSNLLAPLGQAGIDLIRAEYGVVSSEIRTSGRELVRSLLLLLFGLFAMFWAIGALAHVLLEVGALWLPRWGAALAVLGLFVLVGAVFAGLARKRLRSIEPPTRTVRRRLDEHRDWWEERVASARPIGRARQGRHGSDDSLPPSTDDERDPTAS